MNRNNIERRRSFHLINNESLYQQQRRNTTTTPGRRNLIHSQHICSMIVILFSIIIMISFTAMIFPPALTTCRSRQLMTMEASTCSTFVTSFVRPSVSTIHLQRHWSTTQQQHYLGQQQQQLFSTHYTTVTNTNYQLHNRIHYVANRQLSSSSSSSSSSMFMLFRGGSCNDDNSSKNRPQQQQQQLRLRSDWALSDTSRIEPTPTTTTTVVMNDTAVVADVVDNDDPSTILSNDIPILSPDEEKTSDTTVQQQSISTTIDNNVKSNDDAMSSLSSLKTTTTTPPPRSIILTNDEQFIRPERDLRSYRYIQLCNNQLQCLLVCDNMQPGDIGVEAASIHVQAGHFDDTIPGLAHFHEHMLFLGTKKYPNEDEYESFLSQYGGYSNAYTDMEDTNYFFSITTDAEECFTTSTTTTSNDDTGESSSITTTPIVAATKCTDALYGAMDRLAQFFIAPTFDRDMVDRELRAIDSEYRNGLTNDSWRNFQLLKLAANQSHPISKFGCGNYETLMSLGLDVLLQHLQQFWKSYYQTNNLRLTVVGHGSLDALQSMVEETFGQLPKPEYTTSRHTNSKSDQFFIRENAMYDGITAYGTDQLGLIRYIVPITETRTIKFMFATPPLDDPAIRSSKPYRSLSHFLGHESPGSLHALLNDEGLLTSLSSGLALDTTDFSLFSITIGLTPKGMSRKDDVIDLVFQWIALLRDRTSLDLRKSYHDELRQISNMAFRFRENDDPTDFCSMASEQLFEDGLDPARVLITSNEAGEYDPIVESEFLKRLQPDNCMIHVVDSDQDISDSSPRQWKTEKWYGGIYSEERFTIENITAWTNPSYIDTRLFAPALNAYIPTDLSLRCDDDEFQSTLLSAVIEESEKPQEDIDLISIPPKILIDRPNLRLWQKTDQFWRVPKAFVKVAILSPSTYQSPRSMTLNRIFQRVLNDDLNSFVYDASQAGCNYKVSCTPSGYRVSVKGYSEKLPFLLETLTSRMVTVIQKMKDGDTKLQDKFDKCFKELLRETRNYRLDAPNEVANYNSRLLIEQNVWCLDAYIAAMEGPFAERNPLTMAECAKEAELSLMGRLKCEAICMGNIDEKEAQEVVNVLDRHFLAQALPLSDIEIPSFRSMMLPTRDEAIRLFGPDVSNRPIPLVYQELAFTETEENNAVEYILQAGCELNLGYEGLAILDLICHMAYNSAFAVLRTQLQLGYIVSAHARKTAGGAWGMSIVVQSSVALPEELEVRCEEWLVTYRQELEQMTPEQIAQEASAVVAQLLEKDTKMSQEVGRVWSEILNTEGLTDDLKIPEFNRVKYLADELVVTDDADSSNYERTGAQRKSALQLKQKVLDFFDKHFAATSPARRGLSSRVYRHESKKEYEAAIRQPGVLSSYADMRYIKQFMSTWPNVPYWYNPKRQR